MSPTIALFVYGCMVVGLLILDIRRKPEVSGCLWIPLVWLMILASRPMSAWLNPSTALDTSGVVEAGSATDRNLDIALMVAGVSVLYGRRVDWAAWVRQNKWVVAFFLYCGFSIFWSDFPEVALKRWIRAIGALIMILLVVSESDPITAVRTLIRRCAYVLIPLSVLFIKYYPELGVQYDYWSGERMVVGVAVNKNVLGRLCLVAGVFGLWDIVSLWRDRRAPGRRVALLTTILFLVLTLWLLLRSDSATSLLTFLVGSGVFLGLGTSMFRKRVRHLGTLTILGSLIVVVIILFSSMLESLVLGVGRNMTFTTRTFLWEELLGWKTNPLVGVGYDSFWLGDRLNFFVEKYNVNTAHNGYLETYLELGVLGAIMLAGLLLGIFRRAKTFLRDSVNFDYGRIQLAMLFVFLLYNITEVANKPRNLLFFLLLLVGIGFPRRVRSPTTLPRDQSSRLRSVSLTKR
jgi:exopolysaccharide production protein ExoQ